jgi:hypothetical protein
MICSLSSDNGFKELNHNVKKYSCFVATAQNLRRGSLYKMEMHIGDLYHGAVFSEESCFT